MDGAASGESQAAAARRALMEQQKKATESVEEKQDGQLTARQLAMKNLAKGGVVSQREAQGIKGESLHSQAMKNLGVSDQPQQKVIPNWKMTGAQRAAYEEKKAMRAGGESQMSAAMKAFGGQLGSTSSTPSSTTSTPRTMSFAAPPKPSPSRPRGDSAPPTSEKVKAAPPTPANVVSSAPTSGAGGAAEAEEGVTNDLKLLVAGIRRLGVAEADGSMVATFGKIVDDEELEQQLESLVGTLKAGRRRGVLEWQGQLLLKGKDDAAPIKLVATEAPKADEAKADEEPKADAAPEADEAKAEEAKGEAEKADEPAEIS